MTPTQPVVLGTENEQLIQIVPLSVIVISGGDGRDATSSSGSVEYKI